MSATNRFVIKTLGCKVNRSESDNIAAVFRKKGLVELGPVSIDSSSKPDPDRVGVCIVNTCTVTEKASMQSRQAIRQAIRSYPNARIIVTGCYAQTQPEDIQKIEGVSRVVPQQDKQHIVRAAFSETEETAASCQWPDANTFSPDETLGERTRAVLKVQDGCNSNCTYCIVPKARGKSRSMPEAQVISNLHGLGRAGYREVVLSGIHLGCYGLDLSPPSSLPALLEKIEGLGLMRRIRLSSIEPGELSDDIIDMVARSEVLCPHFHIPLQSGDDTVLRKMGRLYSRSFFGNLVQKVCDRIPDVAIGVDVLVGFPGESDTAFQNTFDLIDSLPVAYLHVFPFSPRKTTPAYDMPNKVPVAVIKARAARMRALGEKKRRTFYDALTGRSVEILVEGAVNTDSGLFRGRTANYVPVHFTDHAAGNNLFVTVKVEKTLGNRGVLATPISSPSVP